MHDVVADMQDLIIFSWPNIFCIIFIFVLVSALLPKSVCQDRATEHEKLGKDWKFALILALHCSPHLQLLVEAIPERVEALVQQG